MMRRCPYCAEEIQAKARICRFCHNSVRRVPYRLLLFLMIVGTLCMYGMTHRSNVETAISSARQAIHDVRYFCKEFSGMVRQLPETGQAFQNYRERAELLKGVLNPEKADAEIEAPQAPEGE